MFFDPTQYQKQYYEDMEKLFVQQFNTMLQNPNVLSQVGKEMSKGLDAKKLMDEGLSSYLEKANIPSRNDIAKVLQYLQTIESRIISLEEKIEDLSDKLDKKIV